MPEATQFQLSHHEVAEALIKKLSIHEGQWMLYVEFNFGAGNFGQDEKSVLPGALVAISKIGLQRAPAGAPAALVVDAAMVNPAPGAAKAKKRT